MTPMCREGPKDKQKRMTAMEKLHIFVWKI
jgi:hypothetical protein